MIVTSWPSIIVFLAPNSLPSIRKSLQASLVQAQGHLNVTRRWMRLFRFLDCFQKSWALYTSPSPKDVQTWLEVSSQTSLGIFGLMESITLPDVTGVYGFDFFGAKRTQEINLQAQLFWFLGLYASALASGLKIFRLFTHQPMPPAGSGYGAGEEPPKEAKLQDASSSDKAGGKAVPVDKDRELEKDREKLRAIVQRRKAQRKAWMRQIKGGVGSLTRSMLSDMVDLLIPMWAMGWVGLDRGWIGVAMLSTSVLTSMGVWARINREIEKRSA